MKPVAEDVSVLAAPKTGVELVVTAAVPVSAVDKLLTACEPPNTNVEEEGVLV